MDKSRKNKIFQIVWDLLDGGTLDGKERELFIEIKKSIKRFLDEGGLSFSEWLKKNKGFSITHSVCFTRIPVFKDDGENFSEEFIRRLDYLLKVAFDTADLHVVKPIAQWAQNILYEVSNDARVTRVTVYRYDEEFLYIERSDNIKDFEYKRDLVEWFSADIWDAYDDPVEYIKKNKRFFTEKEVEVIFEEPHKERIIKRFFEILLDK